MLTDVNTVKIQFFAIIGSLLLLVFIFELIRRKKIKEQFSLLWLFVTSFFIIISVWRDGLEEMSRFMGIAYAPAAFLLILVMGIFIILIQFSIIISKLSENQKNLIQEIGLLKNKIEQQSNQQVQVAKDGN